MQRGPGGQRPRSWRKWCDRYGWLWRLCSTPEAEQEVWERVWVCVKGNVVLLFNSEEDAEPRTLLTAEKDCLADIALADPASSSSPQRYRRGLKLRVSREQRNKVVEDSQASSGADAPLQPTAGSSVHLFAAETEEEHSKWKSTMQQATRTLSSKQEDVVVRAINGNGISPCNFAPSPLVVSRLCNPGRDKGQKVLKRFRSTRRTFEEGVRNLGAVREEAAKVKQEMSLLHILLTDMQQAVANHHTPDDFLEDGQALRECKSWLDNAVAFVLGLDAEREELLSRDAGGASYLAGEWVTFSQNAIVQLKDIEEAMQLGQMIEAQHQHQQGQSPPTGTYGPLSKLRCFSTLRSRLPYNTYWARKIAI